MTLVKYIKLKTINNKISEINVKIVIIMMMIMMIIMMILPPYKLLLNSK